MHYLRDKKAIFFVMLVVFIFIVIPYDSLVINSIREMKGQKGLINQFFDTLMPIAKFLGDGAFIALIAIILWLVGRLLNRELLKKTGKLMFIGYIASGIAVQALKHLFGRARPRITDDVVFIGPSFVSGFDSFPSGHTAVVFCLAYIFSIKYRRLSSIFFTFAVITAIERVYNLSHFPSDIIAGALTGLVTGAVLIKTDFYKKMFG
ncbi:MAG TPA: phosphatase PAP2 family protein [Nitrospirae bacterium]|nr:phosphatase PAP2 family protein [Nitrospirota bacterium]